MADSYKLGYDEERFVVKVNRNFLCSICLNVLRDPVLCPRNQHCFCRACITKHLERLQRCPTCADEMTIGTLTEPQRMVKDVLDEMDIYCCYFNRGCQEIVQLQQLENHEATCVFSPVVCTNEGCDAIVNRRDLILHECGLCEFRKLKCHSSQEMVKRIADVEERIANVERKIEKIETKVTRVDLSVLEMKKATEVSFEAVKADIGLIKDEFQAFGLREKEDHGKVKDTREDDTRFTTCGKKENIIVLGSEGDNSVEMFNWNQRSWAPLQSMPEHHWGATSFVYNDHVTVAGGYCPDAGYLDKMIGMSIDPVPDQSTHWSDYAVQLPTKLAHHSSVLFNDQLLVSGGCSGSNRRAVSNNIHSVQLVPPFSVKTLHKMPEPRQAHCTELFNENMFIIGGSTTGQCESNLSSVLLYNIKKNECKQVAPLPYAVSMMATVKWADNIVIIGGNHKQAKTLDTVIMYNVKTGQRHLLPPMRCKRSGCEAVVIRNNIVVIGGLDEEGFDLKSVESFSFNRYTWEKLPDMSEERRCVKAVVI